MKKKRTYFIAIVFFLFSLVSCKQPDMGNMSGEWNQESQEIEESISQEMESTANEERVMPGTESTANEERVIPGTESATNEAGVAQGNTVSEDEASVEDSEDTKQEKEDGKEVEKEVEKEAEKENKSESYIGLAEYKNRLCYFKNGQVDVSYTGLAEYENQTWYVSGGLVDKEYSGVVEYEGTVITIENGIVIIPEENRESEEVSGNQEEKKEGVKPSADYVGLMQYKGNICYFRNGTVDVDFTGLSEYENQTWYVSGGLVDKGYSGLLEYEGKQWCVENGLVQNAYTGVLTQNDSLHVYKDGFFDEQFSGVVEYEGKKWYAISGLLDESFHGTALVDNSMWEVKNGVLEGLFTGIGECEDGAAYYVDGVIDATVTGIIDGQDAKWYVVNGVVDKDYTGVYCNEALENYVVINGKVSSSFTKDDLVRTYYAEREALWLQMKYVMLQTLGDMHYVHFDESEKTVDVAGTVIDAMGLNSIASESLKQAIKSASEGKSLEEIANSAIDGAVSGGVSYVEDAVKEGISTYFLGFNLFGVVDKVIGVYDQINNLFNPDDTPVVMVNALIDDQEKDIGTLVELINAESVTTQTVYQMEALFQGILQREEMLADALDKTAAENAEEISKSMRIMAQSYGVWNQYIIQASKALWEESVQLDMESLKKSAEFLKLQAEKDRGLYDFVFQPFVLEYDVAGYSDVIKGQRVGDNLLGAVAGSLWGDFMDADHQNFSMSVQEYQRDYFRTMSSYQAESYKKLLEAKAEYDAAYGYYFALCEDDSEDALVENYNALGTITEEIPWKEEREQLLECLAAYVFDMECIDEVYQCSLSEYCEDYLEKLSSYRTDLETLLDGQEAVSVVNEEEQNQIYTERVKAYVEFFIQNVRWGAHFSPIVQDPVTVNLYDGKGPQNLYGKKFRKAILPSSSNHLSSELVRLYNKEGEPFYVHFYDDGKIQGEVYIRNGVIVAYNCSEQYAKNLYNSAVSYLQEFEKELSQQ